MINNKYNKNTLEAVTPRHKVSGEPVRSYSSFRLTKTILIFILMYANNSFCQDIYKKLELIYIQSKPETAQEAEDRVNKEKIEKQDVMKNIQEVREGKYWVDGRWVTNRADQYTKINGQWVYNEIAEPARLRLPTAKEDVIDSDKDGYDDYTEHINGTNPNDITSYPAMKQGNNKVTFKMDGIKDGGFKVFYNHNPSLENENKELKIFGIISPKNLKYQQSR